MVEVKRLVVTGASGFIGERLVDVALQNNIEVVALVRRPEAIRGRPGLTIRAWEFGDSLPQLGQPDAICHLAAVVPRDMSDPTQAARCFEANVLGSMTLAAQAADQGIGRFVYFSSGQLYSGGITPASEDAPTYPLERASYYLSSKLAGEICVQALGHDRGLDVTVLRLASVYGAGMHGRGMLPIFITRLSSGQPVTVRDGGAYCVDFVHVDDVVELAFRALEANARGIFNAGTGEARSSLEAANIVARTLGADPALVTVEGQAKRHGFAALDSSKALHLLGYSPKRLEEGLAVWQSSGQLANFKR